jgi:hypothetical protein
MLSKAFELDNVLGYQSNTISVIIKTWLATHPISQLWLIRMLQKIKILVKQFHLD